MAWNRSSDDGRAVSMKPPLRRDHRSRPTVWCVAAIVVLCAAIAAWWIWPTQERGEDAASTVNATHIREVVPAAAPKYMEKEEQREPHRKRVPTDPASLANIAEREAFLERAKKNPETMYAMTNRNYKSKGVFETGVEQVLNRIFACTLGEMPPIPPGMISEADKHRMAEILISKVEVNEEDSERTAMMKENVQLAKKELAKYIKEGGTPQEFIDYYYNELHRAYNRREDAKELLFATCAKDDPEIAKAFYLKTNEMLQKDGIAPIELPLEYKRKLKVEEGENK